MTEPKSEPEELDPSLFDGIMTGMEQAIACQRGEPVKDLRAHWFERLPDGTVRHVAEVTHG